MDCFNHSCPFRVNETSNPNRCECVACQNRSSNDFVITSNRTLTDEELAMLTALRSEDEDYDTKTANPAGSGCTRPIKGTDADATRYSLGRRARILRM